MGLSPGTQRNAGAISVSKQITQKEKGGRSQRETENVTRKACVDRRADGAGHISVPAVELVGLVQPAEHPWYPHQQAGLEHSSRATR